MLMQINEDIDLVKQVVQDLNTAQADINLLTEGKFEKEAIRVSNLVESLE